MATKIAVWSGWFYERRGDPRTIERKLPFYCRSQHEANKAIRRRRGLDLNTHAHYAVQMNDGRVFLLHLRDQIRERQFEEVGPTRFILHIGTTPKFCIVSIKNEDVVIWIEGTEKPECPLHKRLVVKDGKDYYVLEDTEPIPMNPSEERP